MTRNLTVLGWAAFCCLALIFVAQTLAQDTGERGNPDPKDVPKAISELQDRVDQLERQIKKMEKDRDDQAEKIKTLDKQTTTLTQRVEDIDRNKFGQVEREIELTNRAVKDLDRRLKRIE